MTYAYECALIFSYIFEALIVNLLFSEVFIKKYSKTKHNFILFGTYLILFIIHSFNNTLLNLFSFITINLILSLVLFEGKLVKKIQYTIFFTLIMLVTEVIALFIMKIIYKNDLTLSMEAKIFLAIISKIMLFLLIKLFCNVLSKNSNKIPADKFIALMMISITNITILYVIISITLEIKIDTFKSIALLISALGLMFSNILIFYLIEQSIKEQTTLKEYALLKQKSQMEHEHYQILKNNYNNVKIIEHDIKKHLRLINEYAKKGRNEEINNYIQSINGEILSLSHKPISSSKALDIILNEKMQISHSKNIEFKLNIQNVNIDFIEDNDICTIFSNILDNAIESCEKSENKEITVEIYMVNGKFVTIELVNNCDVVPVIKDDELITSKNNLNDHGYGLKSVKKTIRKYNGQFLYFYNKAESRFITNISIPII